MRETIETGQHDFVANHEERNAWQPTIAEGVTMDPIQQDWEGAMECGVQIDLVTFYSGRPLETQLA